LAGNNCKEARLIRTQELTKLFDGRLAVDRLTLAVKPGEILGLLGPNGAGKTTTSRMLACLIAPSSGEAEIGGLRVGEKNDDIRRLVGIVTEVPGLYERLSAEKNLEFYARLYGVDEVAVRVEKYLRMLDLWQYRKDRCGGFSKGMKQKLALARALIHEPKVLLLDEPTSGLDPQVAQVVRKFILELKSQGRAILLCTHNLDEAQRLCDRIAVLKTRMIAIDTPEALRKRLFGSRIVIRLNSVTPELVATARSLAFVREIDHDDGSMFVQLEDPRKQTPDLIRKLVNASAEIQSVVEEQHSLSDVYLKLVDEAREQEA
jgi:ABC-2 type transport system ATP-binding protein